MICITVLWGRSAYQFTLASFGILPAYPFSTVKLSARQSLLGGYLRLLSHSNT